MVEFPFVPWRGAYPIGLTHMIGGLSGAATGALRALLDSAYIQNVPTLLKLKGGPNGQTLNVQPTEIVEMEGGALIDDVRKLAMPLPFAGPSPTLFQLLGFLVDAGKGVVQTSFEKFNDQNPNAPVGTTMAVIEQGMVVFSSIHSRLHAAMARSFNIIHRINSMYYTQEELDGLDVGLSISADDFTGPSDVVPISNPAIFSEAQRFAQIQAIMNRAQQMPQMYDQRAVEEMFLRTLKVPGSEVLNQPPGSEDRDPVTENVAAAMGQPIYVLPQQDHIAHLEVHLPFLKSPMFGMNPAIQRVLLYPMAMHLKDHLLNYYLVESHDAVDKAVQSKVIKDDAPQQVEMILRVQKFIEETLGGFGQELAQITEAAQEFQPKDPTQNDPTMQIAQMSAQIKQSELAQKAEFENSRLALDNMKLENQSQMQQMKMAQEAEIERMKIGAKERQLQEKVEQDNLQQLAETERTNIREMSETDRLMTREKGDDRRKAEDLAARERMNNADNTTAKELAQMEMESDEKTSFTTGGGINPNP
tara:strand:- start:2653 stop:4245 length:1593 start_codon:yes stop_codon:yes gene_type:complete